MSTIQALQIQKQGGPEVVEVIPIPAPQLAPGKVIVKNEYAGVNMIDTYHYGGLYKLPTPIVIGQEASGTVAAVADDVSPSVFKVGDKVVQYGAGSYSEQQLVDAERLVKLPQGIDTRTAAASFLQGLTAWTLVREAHAVKSGDWVLVTAAAGGVGLLLCQMASSLGAKVIGVASTQAKCDLAKQHGAAHTLIYSKDSMDQLVAQVKEITNGHGVDAIFDGVGKDTWEACFEMVARKGSIVTFGNASGPIEPFAPLRLAAKNIKVCRPTLFNYVSTLEERQQYSAELFEMITSGKVKINIHAEYPFTTDGMRKAFSDIKSRGTTGKLVVKIDGSA
ncbi:NAD(P)-binding protein [Testicularia cyperi]|uniref:Probable quinone oxidoreductase n=1 Tax=Testicularia cyperi TaxID=1882483 RepID=A0A317Y0B1_9BASI|nr:NAD(P)-binding protein [Testicularia cyperi]